MAAPWFRFRNNVPVVDHGHVSVFIVLLYYALLLIGGNGHQAGPGEGFLLCRRCGIEVGKSSHLLYLPTSKALRRRNDTLADKHPMLVQLLQNPYGVQFEVITTRTAEVHKGDDRYAAETWFPGFAWSLISCPRCGTHLGWWFDAIYESFDSLEFKITSFVGFILDKIMHEDEESSLLAAPKSYMS